MIRALLLLLAAILLISVLRAVRAFLVQLSAQPKPPAPGGTPLKPEALKKDPVCGTFVAPSTAVRKDRDGQTFYFCSPACRDKF